MSASQKHELPSHSETSVWVWDHDRRKIVWANEAAIRLWGEQSLLDLVDRDFSPADHATAQFAQLLHASLSTDTQRVRTKIVLSPDGKPARFEASASRYRLPDGRTGLRIEAVPATVGTDGMLDRMTEIFENTPQAMALFAEDGSLLIQNAAADFVFGTSDLRGLAQRYGERKTARDALRALLVTGSFSHSAVLRTRVGPRRHRVTMRRLLDPVTGGLAALVVFADTAEREASSMMALAGERDAEATVLSLMQAGVVVYDDALKPLYMSDRARTLLGTPEQGAEAQLGRLFPRDRKRISDVLTGIRDGNATHGQIDLTVRDEQGGARWIELQIRRGDWRGADAWITTVTDVTAARRAAITVQRASDDRDVAAGLIGVGMAGLNEDGTIVHLTKQGAALLDMDDADIGGVRFRDLLDDRSAEKFDRILGERDTNDAFTVTLRPTKDDETPRMTVGIGPVDRYNRNFRIATFAQAQEGSGSTPNMFDRKEAVARASHELRTPLNAIMGFTQLMLDDTSPIQSPAYIQYLQDINESGTYMLRLLQDLLDLRRIEAGALSLETGPIDLGNLVRIITRELDFGARKRNVDITISVEPDLPAVFADMHTMRQALTNIMGNAVKFAAESGWVRVSAVHRASGAVELEVIDNGTGMTAEELESALKPFSQMQGSQIAYGGAGMGLPLAKGFIEANRARFELTSEKGLGTIARIVFPPTRTAGRE